MRQVMQLQLASGACRHSLKGPISCRGKGLGYSLFIWKAVPGHQSSAPGQDVHDSGWMDFRWNLLKNYNWGTWWLGKVTQSAYALIVHFGNWTLSLASEVQVWWQIDFQKAPGENISLLIRAQTLSGSPGLGGHLLPDLRSGQLKACGWLRSRALTNAQRHISLFPLLTFIQSFPLWVCCENKLESW